MRGEETRRPVNVTRSSMPPFGDYCREIRDLWDSRWLTNMGAKHEELRRELEAYLDVSGLDLLVNGHMAIELALQALGLHGEVLTTPFTFASTTHAIVRAGLTPVFCDVDPETFTLDPDSAAERATSRTCAILPVHVYGTVCDTDGIGRLAAQHGWKVVYDAAHAFGVRVNGRGVGRFGDASCFSFHATKVFHSVEGGAVSFHDPAFGARLGRLKNFGLDGYDAPDCGPNGKLNEFCAAMGLCNLRYLDGEIAARGRAAARYRHWLEGIPGIQLAPVQPGVTPNYAYFPAVFDETVFGAGRDAVLAALAAEDIHARRYFHPLTSAFSCWRGAYDPAETPEALRLSRRVLSLPLYAGLDDGTVDRVCEIILSCRDGGRPNGGNFHP